ncbi:MAG TPA: glycosyl hydrolase [Solirubrobacter sp.]|nr:glycosyl hydrolase [Solirubrobacter sp.]
MLLLAAIVAALVLAAPANAKPHYRVGISEQNPAVFDQPTWQALKLKRVRYVVYWDYYKDPGQVAEVSAFLNAARAHKQDVLVMFTAHRGCWNGKRYSRSKVCRAPSTSAYRRAVRKFRQDFPWVKTFAPWNEANHASQPTAKSPKRAAQYYSVLRRECKKCKVLAADVLDQSDVTSYLRRFIRYSKNKGRLWGLHNYKDVNRRQSKGLRNVLRTVPGQVWLTETGGITTFETSGFKTSAKRAASSTKYMFKLADRYDTRKRGYKSKLTRLYVYRWFGEPGGNFDSGLVNPDGSPRPAYEQFVKFVKRRLK